MIRRVLSSHPWLWHALFDGTRLCRCRHSQELRAIGERINAMTAEFMGR